MAEMCAPSTSVCIIAAMLSPNSARLPFLSASPLHAVPAFVELKIVRARRGTHRPAVDQQRPGNGHAVLLEHRNEAQFSADLDILFQVGFGSVLTIH